MIVNTEPTTPAVPTAAMIRTLALVAGLCGLLIVAAHQGTLSAVAENKRIALERAIKQVIPKAQRIVQWHITPAGQIEPAPAEPAPKSAPSARRFFTAYDEKGALAGMALEGAAKGYADQVRILFAWQPACQCITGFALVASRETPGIGDKIVKDQRFLANFEALQASLDAEGKALAQRIVTVKHGSKTQPWQIDAISGATITSRAVGRAIDEAAQAMLPAIAQSLDRLQGESL